jgi:adenylate cyclase
VRENPFVIMRAMEAMPPTSPENACAVPDRTRPLLASLLGQMIQFPERRAELEATILKTFNQRKAILVLDMSGFSRTTHLHGIVAFLLIIHQTRTLCEPCIRRHRGVLVKAEADNLFCLFDNVPDALGASREIMHLLEAASGLLPADRRLHVSIGLGFGDTLYVGEEDLFGDEVNLASKLGEDIAEKGEILLTEAAMAGVPTEAATAVPMDINISGLKLRYFCPQL